MEALTMAFLSLFAVYGFISIIDSVCESLYLRRQGTDRVIIYVKSNEERVEGLVRHLVSKNPEAEIIISEEENSEEIRKIIDKLANEYACVHIGRME